jgi:hypothetical protein
VSIRILEIELYLLPVKTRLPFRYGMVTLRECPHLICQAVLEIDGVQATGCAADHLPPKWFSKDPDQSFEDELKDMLAAVRSACTFARDAGAAGSVFELWQRVDAQQSRWGAASGQPALLSGFGTTFIERAAIDGFCRAAKTTFARAVRHGRLGLRLGAIHSELEGMEPSDLLPPAPLAPVIARHTVGLLDPLTGADVAPADRVDDGLPQSLEDCIRAYGLTHFKLKLSGEPSADAERLRRIADVLNATVTGRCAITLDGNENFRDIGRLAELSELACADPVVQPLFASHLLFIEQPLPREIALAAETADLVRNWSKDLPMIIDESGATAEDVRAALDCGYVGTSHKNCKGVFKGIANGCLLEHRRGACPGARFILSGEDLSTIGPVSLQQDLAVHATLGIGHIERNGHHYFAGLSMWPAHVQEAALRSHPDLYRRSPRAFPSLRIENGSIRTASIIDAPFGVGFEWEPGKIAGAQRVNA